jgi:type III pantothenate kinase
MINRPESFLLIDIGNTRAKWSYVSHVSDPAVVDLSSNSGFVDRSKVSELSSLGTQIQPTTIACVGVVDKDLIQQWLSACKALWPDAKWLEFKSATKTTIPGASIDVSNTYFNPESLGADRWAAILGAQSILKKTNLLVVNAGTATTIDYLSQDGNFSGGWILPGLELMLKSLATGTAALPDLTDLRKNIADLSLASFGQSTDDCMLQGCIGSQVGAILRAQEISQASQVILSGGNAPALLKDLQLNHPNLHLIFDPYIVLRGLYAWASNQTEGE